MTVVLCWWFVWLFDVAQGISLYSHWQIPTAVGERVELEADPRWTTWEFSNGSPSREQAVSCITWQSGGDQVTYSPDCVVDNITVTPRTGRLTITSFTPALHERFYINGHRIYQLITASCEYEFIVNPAGQMLTPVGRVLETSTKTCDQVCVGESNGCWGYGVLKADPTKKCKIANFHSYSVDYAYKGDIYTRVTRCSEGCSSVMERDSTLPSSIYIQVRDSAATYQVGCLKACSVQSGCRAIRFTEKSNACFLYFSDTKDSEPVDSSSVAYRRKVRCQVPNTADQLEKECDLLIDIPAEIPDDYGFHVRVYSDRERVECLADPECTAVEYRRKMRRPTSNCWHRYTEGIESERDHEWEHTNRIMKFFYKDYTLRCVHGFGRIENRKDGKREFFRRVRSLENCMKLCMAFADCSAIQWHKSQGLCAYITERGALFTTNRYEYWYKYSYCIREEKSKPPDAVVTHHLGTYEPPDPLANGRRGCFQSYYLDPEVSRYATIKDVPIRFYRDLDARFKRCSEICEFKPDCLGISLRTQQVMGENKCYLATHLEIPEWDRNLRFYGIVKRCSKGCRETFVRSDSGHSYSPEGNELVMDWYTTRPSRCMQACLERARCKGIMNEENTGRCWLMVVFEGKLANRTSISLYMRQTICDNQTDKAVSIVDNRCHLDLWQGKKPVMNGPVTTMQRRFSEILICKSQPGNIYRNYFRSYITGCWEEKNLVDLDFNDDDVDQRVMACIGPDHVTLCYETMVVYPGRFMMQTGKYTYGLPAGTTAAQCKLHCLLSPDCHGASRSLLTEECLFMHRLSGSEMVLDVFWETWMFWSTCQRVAKQRINPPQYIKRGAAVTLSCSIFSTDKLIYSWRLPANCTIQRQWNKVHTKYTGCTFDEATVSIDETSGALSISRFDPDIHTGNYSCHGDEFRWSLQFTLKDLDAVLSEIDRTAEGCVPQNDTIELQNIKFSHRLAVLKHLTKDQCLAYCLRTEDCYGINYARVKRTVGTYLYQATEHRCILLEELRNPIEAADWVAVVRKCVKVDTVPRIDCNVDNFMDDTQPGLASRDLGSSRDSCYGLCSLDEVCRDMDQNNQSIYCWLIRKLSVRAHSWTNAPGQCYPRSDDLVEEVNCTDARYEWLPSRRHSHSDGHATLTMAKSAEDCLMKCMEEAECTGVDYMKVTYVEEYPASDGGVDRTTGLEFGECWLLNRTVNIQVVHDWTSYVRMCDPDNRMQSLNVEDDTTGSNGYLALVIIIGGVGIVGFLFVLNTCKRVIYPEGGARVASKHDLGSNDYDLDDFKSDDKSSIDDFEGGTMDDAPPIDEVDNMAKEAGTLAPPSD